MGADPSPADQPYIRLGSDELTGEVQKPVTGFMFTLDQIAYMLNISMSSIPQVVRFVGVNRVQPRKQGEEGPDTRMKAVNILPSELHDKKDWRVPEREFERYLRAKGIVVYERKMRRPRG